MNNQVMLPNRYTVVPRTLIFLFDGDSVLLLKGAPTKKIWAGLYNGVGGHVEKGEDILSSARREVLEETGLQVEDLELAGIIMIDTEKEQCICGFVFRGSHCTGTPISSDEGELEWVSMHEFNRFPLVEDLPIILPRIWQKKDDEEPFYAIYSYDSKGRLSIRMG